MNYGKQYYQHYFDSLELEADGQLVNIKNFNGGADLLKAPHLEAYDHSGDLWRKLEAHGLYYKEFELETTYPGLLCGIGYHHEINKPENEEAGQLFQLGMYFDYSSGLPVIPGSSIKGALRAAVEEWDFLADDEAKKPIREHKASILKVFENDDKLKEAFVDEVFKGFVYQKDKNIKEKESSIYERDIFFDAIPVASKGSLLGEDYITHHPGVFDNPNPVRFLRVEPEVKYRFRFLLYDRGLFPAELKEKLFKEIITTFGPGAKTNVGYGRFV